MSIKHDIFVENTNEYYVYEPNIGDIVFFDDIWFCRSIVDKIQKLNNGHILIHVVAVDPTAHSGWFNKDKVEINVSPKITWKEYHEYYDKPVFINRQPTQILVPEQDTGVLIDLFGWSSKEMIDKYIRGGRNYEQ